MERITASYLLLVCCFIAGGCATVESQVAQPEAPVITVASAPTPVEAAVALPQLARFRPALGMEYVISVLGEPGADVGSAVHSCFYQLTDGTTVNVRAQINREPRSTNEKYVHGPVISIERTGAGITGTQVIYSSRTD